MKGSIINFSIAMAALLMCIYLILRTPTPERPRSVTIKEKPNTQLDTNREFEFYFNNNGILEQLDINPVEYNTMQNLNMDSVYIYRDIVDSRVWMLSPVDFDEDYIPQTISSNRILRYKRIAVKGIEPVVTDEWSPPGSK